MSLSRPKIRTRTLRRIGAIIMPISAVFLIFNDTNNLFNINMGIMTRGMGRILSAICDKSPYITHEQAATIPQTPLPLNPKPVPTHIQMCTELIARHAATTFDGEEATAGMLPFLPPKLVTEHSHVCSSWEAPHHYLMEILASILVGEFGAKYGIRYDPSCLRTRAEYTAFARYISLEDYDQGIDAKGRTLSSSTAARYALEYDMTTIQQILGNPEVLLKDESITSTMDEEEILNLCRQCIDESASNTFYESNTGILNTVHQSHECIMYPIDTPVTATQLDSAPLPDQFLHDLSPQRQISKPGVALITIHPILTRILHSAANDWIHKTPAPPDEKNSGVVIYWEDSSVLMPARVYSTYIPQSAKSISILVHPLCAAKFSSCHKAARELQEFLRDLYKDTDTVTIDIISSTASAYTRMVVSKLLLCPPGTLSCLLPALVKEKGSFAVVAETSKQKSTFQWFDGLGMETLMNMEVVTIGDRDVELATKYGGYDQKFNPSVGEIKRNGPEMENWYVRNKNDIVIPPNMERVDVQEGNEDDDKIDSSRGSYAGSCTQVRGRMGQWEKTFDYQHLQEDRGDVNGDSSTGSDSRFNILPDIESLSGKGGTKGFFSDGTRRKLPEVSFNSEWSPSDFARSDMRGEWTKEAAKTDDEKVFAPERSGPDTERDTSSVGQWHETETDSIDWDTLFSDRQVEKNRLVEVATIASPPPVPAPISSDPRSISHYKWSETAFPECELDMLSLNGLCDLMTSMGMDTLFFVGDEVQGTMVRSFFNMLGLAGIVKPDENGIFKRDITCPNNENKHFQLNFAFDERLGNINLESSTSPPAPTPPSFQTSRSFSESEPAPDPEPAPVPEPEPTPGILPNGITRGGPVPGGPPREVPYGTDPSGGFTMGARMGGGIGGQFTGDQTSGGQVTPWMQQYAKDPGRTFLVVSPGVRSYSGGQYDQFCDDFNSFLSNVNNANRSNDVVYVRTASPSYSCPYCGGRRRTKEFESVNMFNKFMHQAIYEREWYRRNHYVEGLGKWGKLVPPVFLVDIEHMTETHPGWRKEQEQDQRLRGRLAEYMYGSPPDWWNHLLFTQMVDVAMQQNSNFRP